LRASACSTRGKVLDLLLESPTYEVAEMGQVAYLDVAGTANPEDGRISLFILNRDLSKPHMLEIGWQDCAPGRVLEASVLTGDDLKAVNSFESPQRAAPRPADKPTTSGGQTRLEVPPRSYTVLQWAA
jgi:alpha-N-arabinofuranosidase